MTWLMSCWWDRVYLSLLPWDVGHRQPPATPPSPSLPWLFSRKLVPVSPAHTDVYFPWTHRRRTRQALCALPYLESTALSPCSSVSMMGSPEFFSSLGPEMYNVIFDGGYDLDVFFFFFFSVELLLIHRTCIFSCFCLKKKKDPQSTRTSAALLWWMCSRPIY